MESSIINSTPSEHEIESLKEKLQEAKRKKEYEMLKSEITQITNEAVNTPHEFEGAIQIPDTEKVLHTKRKFKNLTELAITRLGKMLSPRPIIGNLIAIGLAFFALIFLQKEILLKEFGQYQHYIGTGLLLFAALQIVKSSTRSLFLPTLATIVGAIISHSLHHHETFLTYNTNFYQYVMITGIIGIGISVFTID